MSALADCVFLTGERSGDQYAAAIAAHLVRVNPAIRCAGMGGQAQQEAGVEIFQNSDDLDVMGFIPVLKRLPEFLAIGKRVESEIRARRPRLVVSIDYPGFNLRMQKRLADGPWRRLHIVAPQVWAWRARRAKKVAQGLDELHCFFPFEPSLFARFGCDARFVGHPLIDLVDAGEAADGPASGTRSPGEKPVLLLAPGSRRKEIERILPVFIRAAKLLQQKRDATCVWQRLRIGQMHFTWRLVVRRGGLIALAIADCVAGRAWL